MAECSEQDRIQLARDLNREILSIFSKYNVNIPFPQVTISKPQPKEEVASATIKQQKASKEFVQDQKVKTKDIEDEHE